MRITEEKPMENTAALPRPELLQVAEAVARDKGIEKDEVLTAMESAIQKAGRSKYGTDVYVKIDRKTGEILAYPMYSVVADDADPAETEDNPKSLISLTKAREIDPKVNIGEIVIDYRKQLSVDFGRIPAQTAKQVIGQKIRDAERIRQYNEYKDRVGEIINGIVKRVETGSVIVDIGRAEAVLRRGGDDHAVCRRVEFDYNRLHNDQADAEYRKLKSQRQSELQVADNEIFFEPEIRFRQAVFLISGEGISEAADGGYGLRNNGCNRRA